MGGKSPTFLFKKWHIEQRENLREGLQREGKPQGDLLNESWQVTQEPKANMLWCSQKVVRNLLVRVDLKPRKQ